MTGTAETNNSNTEDGEELINFADSNSIEYYARIPNEVLGMISKKVITPNGNVEKIDGDDLVWWGFFYTFLYQKKACYMTRETIAERFDCDPKTVTRRTTKLERLGLLTVNKRSGTSNIYTAATVEQFLAMKTSEKVTPKTEKAEQNGKSESKEQQPAAVEPSTVGNDEQHGLQLTANNRGDDVSPNDAVKSFPWDGDAFLGNGKLAPGSREWAQSQGAKTWEEEIRLVWKLSGLDIEPNETQRPDDVPESQPVKQQKPEPKPELVIEFDDTIPF